MDSKRDRLLKDFAQTLLERTTKAAEDMAGICQIVNIPRYEFDTAASGIYLYMFMTLLSDSKPSITPDELALIVKQQYESFRRLKNARP